MGNRVTRSPNLFKSVAPPAPGFLRAFTLIEILVTIAIIATLMALLLPAMAGTMRSARGFKCQMAQRAVAFDFQLFADDAYSGDRGDDDRAFGGKRFRIETFQEAQYKIDEFWAWADKPTVTMPDDAGNDPMRCPEVKGEVTLRRATACSRGAVTPSVYVSYGFNVRLHIVELRDRDRVRAAPAILDRRVLEHGMVPLFWDVDGARAEQQGVSPVFSGPTLDNEIFGRDRYWFVGARHNGAANFAFVDGHVEASKSPLAEPSWEWDYAPDH